MTILRVQGNKQGIAAGNSPLNVSITSAPINGNILVMCWGSASEDATYASISSITQTGVTWTQQNVKQYYNSDPSLGDSGNGIWFDSEIWIGVVGLGAAKAISVAMNDNTTDELAICDICEYSGLKTSAFLDKTATNLGTSANPTTGTTANTLQANELWIGTIFMAYYSESGGNQTTPTNGFSLLDGVKTQNPSSGFYYSLSYLEKIVSSTGAASSGTTAVAPTDWLACIATFKASGAATKVMVID